MHFVKILINIYVFGPTAKTKHKRNNTLSKDSVDRGGLGEAPMDILDSYLPMEPGLGS